MKKTHLIALAAAVIVGGGAVLAVPAFASTSNGSAGSAGHGYEQMIEAKADIFGMTVEELKTARETMDFEEIALQQGVDIDEMHEQMEARAVARWKDRGMTEAEIAERLALRDEAHAAGQGPYTGGFGMSQGGNGGMNAGANGTGDCTATTNN